MRRTLPDTKSQARAAERAARLRAAVAAGREKRARNRVLLRQRELERDGAGTRGPVFEFVRVLLCGICFLPILGLVLAVAMRLRESFGAAAGWTVGVAGCALMAATVYHGAPFLTASARDTLGILRGWRRDPETLLVSLGLAVLVLGMLASYVFKW